MAINVVKGLFRYSAPILHGNDRTRCISTETHCFGHFVSEAILKNVACIMSFEVQAQKIERTLIVLHGLDQTRYSLIRSAGRVGRVRGAMSI